MVRNEDIADRRNKIITLTSKGKDCYNKVHPIFEEMFNLLNKEVTPGEISFVKDVVFRMNKKVG